MHTLPGPRIASADGIWEYDHRLGTPMNVSAYYFGELHRGPIDSSVSGLRLTSSAIQAEFEDVLLSKRVFRFNDPTSLTAFFTRLTERQRSRVFSVAIGYCILYREDSWLKPLDQLPSTLTHVQFQMYTAFNEYFQDTAGVTLSTLKQLMHEAARVAPNANISISAAGCRPSL